MMEMIEKQFDIIHNFFNKNLSYWNELTYLKTDNDYSVKVRNSKFKIDIKWYSGEGLTWSSQGAFKTILLELGEIENNMIYIRTPFKGLELYNAADLIDYVFMYIKKDEDYIKLLRKNKMERLISDDEKI